LQGSLGHCLHGWRAQNKIDVFALIAVICQLFHVKTASSLSLVSRFLGPAGPNIKTICGISSEQKHHLAACGIHCIKHTTVYVSFQLL
jgi:hypothetical protein